MEFVELRSIEARGFQRNFADRSACFKSHLRDLRRLVVANDRRERGAHGQAAFDIRLAFGGVRLDTGDTASREHASGIGQ